MREVKIDSRMRLPDASPARKTFLVLFGRAKSINTKSYLFQRNLAKRLTFQHGQLSVPLSTLQQQNILFKNDSTKFAKWKTVWQICFLPLFTIKKF